MDFVCADVLHEFLETSTNKAARSRNATALKKKRLAKNNPFDRGNGIG
jgi:hypothetical protein